MSLVIEEKAGQWIRSPQLESLRHYVTISGSGPSAEGYGHVDICTKRRTNPADYIAVSQLGYWKKFGESEIPVMSYRRRDFVEGKKELIWHANEKMWDRYFWSFNPKFKKPSCGTIAVFCAVERWGIHSVGLIGMDWVLDENTQWFHDAKAELAAISNLVSIIDLRDRRKHAETK